MKRSMGWISMKHPLYPMPLSNTFPNRVYILHKRSVLFCKVPLPRPAPLHFKNYYFLAGYVLIRDRMAWVHACMHGTCFVVATKGSSQGESGFRSNLTCYYPVLTTLNHDR